MILSWSLTSSIAVQRYIAPQYGQLAVASVGENPQPQLETTTSATVRLIRYRRISDQAQFQSFAHAGQGSRGGSQAYSDPKSLIAGLIRSKK